MGPTAERAPGAAAPFGVLWLGWVGVRCVDAADICVEIPMIGTGASLNVAVAGSLVLYRLAGLS